MNLARRLRPLVLVLGFALAAQAAEPWAEQTQAAAEAFAAMRTAEGSRAYCLAVAEAPFGEEDPRYPILLYNKMFAATCCGPFAPECGYGDPSRGGNRAFADLDRAVALVRRHGPAREPEYAVVLWHDLMARLERRSRPGYDVLEGPAPGPGCPPCDEAMALAGTLEALAPAFAAADDAAGPGLRLGPPRAEGSWLAGGDADPWPRALLLSNFEYPPALSRKMFPALALWRLALVVRDAGQPARGWELGQRGAALRAKVLGDEHPVTLEGWLDLAARWTRNLPDEALAVLQELRIPWRKVLGGPGHPDEIPLLLALEEAQRAAGQAAEAAATRRALRVAADAPEPARPSPLRVHLASQPYGSRGYAFGDKARARARKLLAARGEAPEPGAASPPTR